MSWRQSTSALRDEVATTRAVNVGVSVAEIRSACEKDGMIISAIEALLSGGTRVVMTNLADADRVRAMFKPKLLDGEVRRTRWVANR